MGLSLEVKKFINSEHTGEYIEIEPASWRCAARAPRRRSPRPALRKAWGQKVHPAAKICPAPKTHPMLLKPLAQKMPQPQKTCPHPMRLSLRLKKGPKCGMSARVCITSKQAPASH